MTDMYSAPHRDEVQMHQPSSGVTNASLGSGSSGGLQQPYSVEAMEAAEMAAFEKGRMAGEMEAMRRAERQSGSEAPQQLKTMDGGAGAPGADADLLAQQALANRPDVLEINRLTWAQKIAAVAGESTSIAYVVLMIVWLVSKHTHTNTAMQHTKLGECAPRSSCSLFSSLCFVLFSFCSTSIVATYRGTIAVRAVTLSSSTLAC